MELRSPASIDEATRWLQASTSTIDTAANRARLSLESIERTLTSGQRSPESTWAHIDGDRVAGLVSGRAMPGGFRLVDIFAVSRPADARALLQRATDWARGSDEREASFGAPVGPLEQTPAADLVRELELLGWQLLVTRQHYEIEAAQMSVRPHPLDASLQRARARRRAQARSAAAAHRRRLARCARPRIAREARLAHRCSAGRLS